MAQTSTPLISYWHPNITYDFTLRIGGKDFSTDLVRVEIRSAVTVPYQQIFLDVFMDPHDLLLDSFFGQQDIKLIIRLKGKLPENIEQVEFDLFYIETEADFYTAQQNKEQDQKEREVIRFKTVCIKPYQTMSQIVNGIYFNSTPYTIITDLIYNNTDVSIFDYDEQGRSKLKIDQLLIPPTTIYNVVEYLDKTYGIFNGPMVFHSNFDNTLKLQNLNIKPKMAQTISLYITATDMDESKIFGSTDPRVFYTQKLVTNSYNANAVFSVQAPTIKYIVKPKDQLSKEIEINLQNIAEKYGIIEANNKSIYYNTKTIDLQKRVGYEKDQTGYDSDETFIISNLTQNILDMATIIVEVTGNLPLLNLMDVGEHVKLISHVNDQAKLNGSYFLKGSDIQFVKATGWESFARIYMSRTNVASQ